MPNELLQHIFSQNTLYFVKIVSSTARSYWKFNESSTHVFTLENACHTGQKKKDRSAK